MKPSTVVILLAAAALAVPTWSQAKDKDKDKDRGRGRAQRGHASGQAGGGSMSAGQAAETARRQTGGRVLSVQGQSNGFRVKVLTPAGEVRYLSVPAGR